jgi:hypothetical protein
VASVLALLLMSPNLCIPAHPVKSKGTRETDAANREKWAAEALATLVSAGLSEIERKRLTCLEAAERVLSDVPACAMAAEAYERHSGRRMTAPVLARMLAEASESKAKTSKPTDAEIARKKLDVLDEAWNLAERSLKSAGVPVGRVYDVLTKAVRDVTSGLITAETGAMAILQTARAELQS